MTTDHATLREARAAGIDAAIEAIEARVANAQGAMAEHGVALRYYRNAVAIVVPGLLSCLRKLAAETRKAEPAKPNPFKGWTILPWSGDELWASKSGKKSIDGDDIARGQNTIVAIVLDYGWRTWIPMGDILEQGEGTGDEVRKLAESALIKAGATIPWQKDPTSEAAGRG